MVKLSLLRNTIHPKPHKNTLNQPFHKILDFPVVHIPLSMHQGETCACQVKKGDEVKVGQVIGRADAAKSAPIHASVSGTVTAVRREVAASGKTVEVVEIKSDGEQSPHPDLAAPSVENQEDFFAAIRDSGLVGLGGVGQPTHHKLRTASEHGVDTLVVNAIECEPYITINHRQCMENPEEIVAGTAAIMRHLSLAKAYIAVEKRRRDAQASLTKALKTLSEKDPSMPDIEIRLLPVQYPHGAEKFLIRELTGRTVPVGGQPHDVRALSLNVGTVQFIAQYLKTGMPLVRKQLTVDGSGVKKPCNVDVPVGALILDLFEAIGGLTVSEKDSVKMILGDSMLGMALDRTQISIIKLSNALLVFTEKEAAIPEENACIRCARCIYACPMKLVPTTLDQQSRHGDVEGLMRYHVGACIECGTCTYVCPAKRYLLPNIKQGKEYVKQAQAREERPS